MNPDRLIEMANDIARNVASDPDPVARIAEHLQKFWAPRMRQQLAARLATAPGSALPEVRHAVNRNPDGV